MTNDAILQSVHFYCGGMKEIGVLLLKVYSSFPVEEQEQKMKVTFFQQDKFILK